MDERAHAAHPRSRGENMASLLKKAPAIGSSPLTRGKHSSERTWLQRWRLIPAHAGKTYGVVNTTPGVEAHPRSRGENDADRPRVGAHAGSSPLTRGKLGLNLTLTGSLRLIPAHAGKTPGPPPPPWP